MHRHIDGEPGQPNPFAGLQTQALLEPEGITFFVNVQLLPFVVRFGVCPLDEMPTHALLQILLSKPSDDYQTARSIKFASLNTHFDEKLKELREAPHQEEGK